MIVSRGAGQKKGQQVDIQPAGSQLPVDYEGPALEGDYPLLRAWGEQVTLARKAILLGCTG